MPGLDPGIHAADQLRISRPASFDDFGMDHRVKPGGDEFGEALRHRRS